MLNLAHDNAKEFDKRTSVESKKAKDIASAMEKVRKALDVEMKGVCVDFQKQVDIYAANPHLSPQLSAIMKSYA